MSSSSHRHKAQLAIGNAANLAQRLASELGDLVNDGGRLTSGQVLELVERTHSLEAVLHAVELHRELGEGETRD